MTLVFVILSAWMLYRTLEATQLTAIATKNAADAAVSSIDVAKKTLDFTIENARLDQGAWVGVVKVIKPPIISEGTHTMGVQITNSGKTPARKVSTRLHPQWVGKGENYTPDLPPGRERQTVLQPGMIIDVTLPPLTFHKSVIAQMSSGDTTMHIYGRISYNDVFGCKHTETFCVYLDRDLSTMKNCLQYNEAEEEKCRDENTQ